MHLPLRFLSTHLGTRLGALLRGGRFVSASTWPWANLPTIWRRIVKSPNGRLGLCPRFNLISDIGNA